MKVVYRNVEQAIETTAWNVVSTNPGRTVVLGSCSDNSDKTSLTAKIRIVSNTSGVSSGSVFLCAGSDSDINNIGVYYGPSDTPITLNEGDVKDFTVTFAVREVDITNDRVIKIGITGSTATDSNALASGLSFEVKYILS